MKESDAFIVEHSIVDLERKLMITSTRNLSHTKIMLIEETQRIYPSNGGTELKCKAKIVSNTWFSGAIEAFGLKTFQKSVLNSSAGLNYVLDKIKEKFAS